MRGIGVNGLRTERKNGNLVTETIAGKEFTTLAEIERMRERCRNRTIPKKATAAGEFTSVTEQSLAAARAAVKKLRESSSESGER